MKKHSATAPHQTGLGLIELMIAMLLGLIVVAAAGSVLLSSQKTYKTTEEMARLQEGHVLRSNSWPRISAKRVPAHVRVLRKYSML